MSRIAITLAAACCLATAAWAERPVVHTRLQVEAPTFKTGLAEDGRETVETRVAEILATEIDHYYKFLTWSPAPADAAGQPAPAAELTLRLIAAPKALGVAIDLEYSPAVGGDKMSAPERAEELYGEFDEQPKDKPDLLIDDLEEAIIERFRDDSFRDAFEDIFLSKIPLTRQVEADGTLEVILVPVSLEDLRATEASELAVTFEAKNANDVLQDGNLTLDPTGKREDRPGWLQCQVRRFDFPPEDESAWHPSIPSVLGAPLLDNAVVYMLDYDLDPTHDEEDTSGALVDELGGGGE